MSIKLVVWFRLKSKDKFLDLDFEFLWLKLVFLGY